MRTIIHIGQHKTGTTSLQHYLDDHRASLAKDGLYVPDSLAGHEGPSHFILNVYALDRNRYSSMKERLEQARPQEYFANLQRDIETDLSRHYRAAEEQGCRDVIWSNEGLYLLNSEQEYDRLRALFERFSSSVVCVCCFRDKEAYRLSRMEELKKQGIAPSDDRNSYRYLGQDSWLLDYDRKKALLASVFDETIVFPYDSADAIKTFMEKIGYPAGPGTASIRMNVTEYGA